MDSTGRRRRYVCQEVQFVFLCCLIDLSRVSAVGPGPSSCPYNFTALDFAPAVSACSQPEGSSNCCKRINALVGIAASQYANSTGSLCLPRQSAILCLNKIIAVLDANGVRPEASRFCGVPLSVKGHCLCKKVETVHDFSQLSGFQELVASCDGTEMDSSSCRKCSTAIDKFTSRFAGPNPSRSCHDAVFVALASLGDSKYATHKASCFFQLEPRKVSDCPIRLNAWQLYNMANVCRQHIGDSSTCCSLSLLILRIAASKLTKDSGEFFISQRQARSCIDELGYRMTEHSGFAPRRRMCTISSDNIFNTARRGCNNILTLSELKSKLAHRNTNLLSRLNTSCANGHESCAECRRAALDAAYAAAWPYDDTTTMQSCMDLTFLMLASNISTVLGTEIGGCLYALPVVTPGKDANAVAAPALPPSEDDLSDALLPPPLTRPSHQIWSSMTVVLAFGIGISAVSVALLLILVLLIQQRKKDERIPLRSKTSFNDWPGQDGFHSVKKFKYKEIQLATNNLRNLVGKGRSGIVYKAKFKDGLVAAVKKIEQNHPDQGDAEFSSEIQFLGRLHHRHLVSLRGFCVQKHERFLVYDYMVNGSLEERLHSLDQIVLPWQRRLQIAIEVATGLEYVHCYCEPPLCHRNIKSSNILLDDNLVAKIGDFRLSNTTVRTPGYLDPEYSSTGVLSEKSDVYSFGVLLLELVSGRAAAVKDGKDIVEWSHEFFSSDCRLVRMIDWRLEGKVNIEELRKVVTVARLCTQNESKMRPSMQQVVNLLMDNMVAFPPLRFTSTTTAPTAVTGRALTTGHNWKGKHHHQRQRYLSDEFDNYDENDDMDTSSLLSLSVDSGVTPRPPSLSKPLSSSSSSSRSSKATFVFDAAGISPPMSPVSVSFLPH